jgi:hypothetical protein
MPKLFTLEEANALLPQLREILADLQRAVDAFERVEGEVAKLRWKVRGNGHNVSDEALTDEHAARDAIGEQISRINELGCELKDPRLGLIDFPSDRDGDVVYLCWKADEPEVAYWHPLDTGFASRLPL